MSTYLVCEKCGLGADRTEVFQTFGFRMTVECECGATVPTGFDESDLPETQFEGRWITGEIEKHEGLKIDADTPLWALGSFKALAKKGSKNAA